MAPYVKVFGHVVGKKHVQALPYWLPSLASYGAIVFLGGCWIYDWDLVMKQIPFYRNKFRFPFEEDKRVYTEPKYDL